MAETIDLTKESDDEQAPAPQRSRDDEAASLALARQLQAEEDAAAPPRRVDERPAKRPRSGPQIERVHAAGGHVRHRMWSVTPAPSAAVHRGGPPPAAGGGAHRDAGGRRARAGGRDAGARSAGAAKENEGFAAEGYVDIFDGGPTMTARTSQVRSVRKAQPGKVSDTDLDIGERALIATGTLSSFRSVYGMREIAEDGSIAIDAMAAQTLEVGEGDEVWSVAR